MVEHWSEKPGVDSSILSLGILFRLKLAHFVVVQGLEYLGAAAPRLTQNSFKKLYLIFAFPFFPAGLCYNFLCLF